MAMNPTVIARPFRATNPNVSRTRIQIIALAVSLAPAIGLGARFALEGFGANPVEDITHVTGEWALRFLLVCLAITPARRFFGWSRLAPLRRTFGLVAFCYATLHMLTWAVLDLGLDPGEILVDLTERPYAMAGMAAFALLAVLAATSTKASIKRLGARWISLHRLVYPAAILAIIHYLWLIKADYRPAIVHGVLLAGLLLARFERKTRPASA